MKVFLFLAPLMFLMPNAFAEVSIQNDQKYIGDDGTLHIVGEIVNNRDVPLRQVEIFANLYAKENVLVDTLSTSSMVNTIMPGMKTPFDFVILGPHASNVESYSLGFDYEISNPKNQVMDITSSDISRDNLNNLLITGTVANKGEITANTISIVATLYDKEGNVAAVSQSLAEPDYLRAEDEAFFLVSVPDKTQTQEVVDYSLVAESEEYAAVPEFPIGSTILLAGSVAGYLLITRYSGKLITNVVSATDLK